VGIVISALNEIIRSSISQYQVTELFLNQNLGGWIIATNCADRSTFRVGRFFLRGYLGHVIHSSLEDVSHYIEEVSSYHDITPHETTKEKNFDILSRHPLWKWGFSFPEIEILGMDCDITNLIFNEIARYPLILTHTPEK